MATSSLPSLYATYYDSFLSSFSLIVFSELGDKTFFVAAIMAMKASKKAVFFGAAVALLLMTLLSAFLGKLSTKILPVSMATLVGCMLMYLFGIKMFVEAYYMRPDHASEEIQDVKNEINERMYESKSIPLSTEDKSYARQSRRDCLGRASRYLTCLLSGPFWQTMVMVFISEWGDRSQLSTIILAAHKNITAVSAGAFAGHCLSTGLAVLAGNLLSSTVSVRTGSRAPLINSDLLWSLQLRSVRLLQLVAISLDPVTVDLIPILNTHSATPLVLLHFIVPQRYRP